MNIAGVLVHARRDRLAPVELALAGMPGVEVHQTSAEGAFEAEREISQN